MPTKISLYLFLKSGCYLTSIASIEETLREKMLIGIGKGDRRARVVQTRGFFPMSNWANICEAWQQTWLFYTPRTRLSSSF